MSEPITFGDDLTQARHKNTSGDDLVQMRQKQLIEGYLLYAFMEHIPDGVYFKDCESRFVLISRSLATRFGLNDPVEAVHKTDADIFTAEHASQAFADEQEIIRTGRPILDKEEKETWPDGSETWVLTTKLPLHNQRGSIIGTMGISRDVTDRKRAEQELQKYKEHLEELVSRRTAELVRANQQLERDVAARMEAEQKLAAKAEELTRSNEDLEKFAYVASHDLQEPLRMVASYTQLLGRRFKGKLGPDADEFIAFAVDGATRMQNLIRDLLSYSRLGTTSMRLELTDSGEACAAAIANLRQSIEHSGTELVVSPLPRVLADPVQLAQLFQNLIGNAIKYRGPDRPQIRVSSESKDEDWIFSVQDNGIGIDSKYFDRIFELFQRLHGRDDCSGTGIGLTICRRIVERYRGRIWVSSQPGVGSTFYFTIPKVQRTAQ